MEKLRLLLLATALCIFCNIAYAQKIAVNGTVVDSDGNTVIGATVVEKGTANGTVTVKKVIAATY
jgi:hypothetical protein